MSRWRKRQVIPWGSEHLVQLQGRGEKLLSPVPLHTMLTVLGAGHWLGYTELQISFLKNVQHSWNPFPFRTASQGTLSTRLLKRLKSAIQKGKWQDDHLASSVDPSPYLSKNWKLYHCMIIVLRMASNHHFTHQSFSPDPVDAFPSCLPHQLCQDLSSTHSRNLLDCLSAVLYLEQTPGKLKSPTRKRANNCKSYPICP